MSTEETKEKTPAPWFPAMAFNVIALAALIAPIIPDYNVGDQETYVKWSVAAVSVNLGLAVLALIAAVLAKEKFSGTVIEGGLVRSSRLSCSQLM
jgi:hypothetical protein